MRFLPYSLALALVGSWAPTAFAWTEADVTSLRATIELREGQPDRVELDLEIQVRAGWLRELDLDGFEPDLRLDPALRVVVTNETGMPRFPSAEVVGEGAIRVRLSRQQSLERGIYRLRLAYLANIDGHIAPTTTAGHGELRWTLPGWRGGLDGVEVQLLAPAGTRFAEVDESVDGMMQHRFDVEDRTALTWRRAHLPRTLPWVVRASVPGDFIAVAAPNDDSPSGASVPTPGGAPRRTTWPWLPLVVVAAAWCKHLLFRRACRRRRAEPAALVPIGGPTLRAMAAFGLAAAATLLVGARIEAAAALEALAVALLLERAPRRLAAPKLGGFRPASRRDLAAARFDVVAEGAGPLAWLSWTTPIGLAIAAGAAWAFRDRATDVVAFLERPEHLALVAPLAPVLVLATPAHLPPSPARRLVLLARLARALRAPLDVPVAYGLSLHADTEGRWQDARLRLIVPERPAGLARLDVALADAPGLGGPRRVPTLLVVTRAETAAEARVAASLPGHPSRTAPGGRRARILPFDGSAFDRLRRWLDPAPEAPSSTPAPLGVTRREEAATATLH